VKITEIFLWLEKILKNKNMLVESTYKPTDEKDESREDIHLQDGYP
jgi:hypothetical protein